MYMYHSKQILTVLRTIDSNKRGLKNEITTSYSNIIITLYRTSNSSTLRNLCNTIMGVLIYIIVTYLVD